MIFPSLLPNRNGHALIEDISFLGHESEEEYRDKSTDYLDGEQLSDFRNDAFLFHKRQRGLVPAYSSRSADLNRAIRMRILHGRDYYLNQYAFAGPVDPRDGQPFSEI